MAVRRLLDGVFLHRQLGCFFNAIARVWLSPRLLEEGLDAARLICFFVPVESVSADAHHLTGLRHIAQLLGQLQQAKLVLHDFLA